jgi:hypothetical protein
MDQRKERREKKNLVKKGLGVVGIKKKRSRIKTTLIFVAVEKKSRIARLPFPPQPDSRTRKGVR